MQQVTFNRTINTLHLEPTDVCQAACAMCAREIDPNFDKKLQHHLTVEQVASGYSHDFIKSLDKMFMCGVYGDPAAGRYTLDLFRYFRQINPKITLGMHSNGALQNTLWWHELALILNQPNDYVVFSIDGLESSNHIYRQHVVWTKLQDNAKAFVLAGGQAHWDMLVFQHNQHQIDQCLNLARQWGFKWFRTKISRRGFSDQLRPPDKWQAINFEPGAIHCHALTEKSEYMDSRGRKFPCCWLGGVSRYPVNFEHVQASWQTNQANSICKNTCGENNKQTSYSRQWQLEVHLV